MEILEYRGFYGTLERGDGTPYDVNWHGHILGLTNGLIIYEGDTMDDLLCDFRNAIDDHYEYCRVDRIDPFHTYIPAIEDRVMSIDLPLAA
jgi:hypothetical protein